MIIIKQNTRTFIFIVLFIGFASLVSLYIEIFETDIIKLENQTDSIVPNLEIEFDSICEHFEIPALEPKERFRLKTDELNQVYSGDIKLLYLDKNRNKIKHKILDNMNEDTVLNLEVKIKDIDDKGILNIYTKNYNKDLER